MDHALFEDRRRALEEEYFRKLNTMLIDRMRDDVREAIEVSALEEASGVADRPLLTELVHMGITAENGAAFAMLPLIEVAWSDGDVDSHERQAVLNEAHRRAIEPGSAAAALLDDWLAERPESELFRLWSEFTRAYCDHLPLELQRDLEHETLVRTTNVAKASGGILGLGPTISLEEHEVLARVKAVYEDPV